MDPRDPDAAAAREREARTARLRTTHADAETVAASLRPDNTDSMSMVVEGDALATAITRETTGGLQSTVDDTVVNLTVADAIVDAARTHTRTHNYE
ncbi:KEOPS complex subunit Pcc1 [Halobellus sp. GM3]|uniref:KEOPS complex subunit Pcc1 n=1 Tax=Halobellus sp. GM3 TaxID=3458410 RepID=UPI00403D7B9C